MSDFLAGLVDRAGERAPLLERRPRSLFEPLASVPPLPAAILAAAAEGEGEPAVDSDMPQAAPKTASRKKPDETASVARPSRARSESNETSAPPPQAQPAPMAIRMTSNNASRDDGAARGATAPHRVVDGRNEHEPNVLHPVQPASKTPMSPLQRAPAIRADHEVRASSSSPSIASSAAGAHLVRSPSPEPRSAALPPVTSLRASSPPASAMPVRGTLHPAAVRSMPAQTLVKAQERARTQNAETSPPAAPAPVHISIGRIELRAAVASAPVHAPKRTALRLTLDDYLRERSGGPR
jgi:hypothetical protein